MGDLDIAAKALMREVPAAVAQLALGGGIRVRSASAEETELPALALRMDKMLRLEVEGNEEPHWLHVEVKAAWKADVPTQTYEYWSRAHRSLGSLLSVVICLKRDPKQAEPGAVHTHEAFFGRRRVLLFEFDVVRVWTLEAADLLSADNPDLLPLLPFTAGATEERVEEALRVLSVVGPASRRAELQAILATFAENAFPGRGWLATIPREVLMESTTIRELRAESQRELLTLLLRKRLGPDAEPLISRLLRCTEKQITQVGELLGGIQAGAELIQALDGVLPQPE